MLPGFRFLFAATLLTVSLLVFGLGAAALLRASHERFASLPLRPAPAPDFPRPAETSPPTLAVLRVEPAPAEPAPAAEPMDTLMPTDRLAALTTAPRIEDVAPALPSPEPKAEIKPEPPKIEAKPDAMPDAAAQSAAAAPAEADPVTVAKIDAPIRVEPPVVSQSEPGPQELAARPEPEITGSTPATIEPELSNAPPIRRPPMPADRPAAADAVAALPAPTAAAPAARPAKPAVRKRKPAAKPTIKPRRVVTRAKPQRPAAIAPRPASPFGASPFGT